MLLHDFNKILCEFNVVAGGSVGSPVLFVVLNDTWFSCCTCVVVAYVAINHANCIELLNCRSVGSAVTTVHKKSKLNSQIALSTANLMVCGTARSLFFTTVF